MMETIENKTKEQETQKTFKEEQKSFNDTKKKDWVEPDIQKVMKSEVLDL